MKLETSNIFENLQIFKFLAQTGSFTECGRILNIPKSKVSRCIQALEEKMGFRLFYRTTRQVQLTPEGKALIEKINPLLNSFEQIFEMQVPSNLQSSLAGEVSITAPEDLGIMLLSRFSTEFSRLFPKIKLEVVITNQAIDLIKENVDLALRVGKMKNSSHIYAKKIASIQMMKVQAVNNQIKKLSDLDQLQQSPFISFGKLQKRKMISLMGRGGRPSKIQLESTMASNSFFVIEEFLKVPTTWSILPKFLVEKKLITGDLNEILPDWQVPAEDLYLLNLSGRNMSPRVRVYFEFLIKKFQGIVL